MRTSTWPPSPNAASLPATCRTTAAKRWPSTRWRSCWRCARSEEHTSELQSQSNLVCRLLLEKKKKPLWTATSPPLMLEYQLTPVVLLLATAAHVVVDRLTLLDRSVEQQLRASADNARGCPW